MCCASTDSGTSAMWWAASWRGAIRSIQAYRSIKADRPVLVYELEGCTHADRGDLETSYSPDREFVDGEVVERHVGEKPHSKVRRNVMRSFLIRYPHLYVWPEQQVR